MTANTTTVQKELLLEYMEKYPTMATNSPKNILGRDCANKRWEALSEKLNRNGPPNKTIKGWKKTWADYKHRAKRKLAANKQSLNKTGGGPFREEKLTQFEEAVAELAKIKAAVYGVCGVKTFCGEKILATPTPTASTSKEAENDVEKILKELMSSEDSDSESDTSSTSTNANKNSAVPGKTLQSSPQVLKEPTQLDKLSIFKESSNSRELYQNKMVELLTDIKNIKREQVEILKKQATDMIFFKKRKLALREQKIEISLKANELKEYELGLKSNNILKKNI